MHGAGSAGGDVAADERPRSIRRRVVRFARKMGESLSSSSGRSTSGSGRTGAVTRDHVTHGSDEATSSLIPTRVSSEVHARASQVKADQDAAPQRGILRPSRTRAFKDPAEADPPAVDPDLPALREALRPVTDDISAMRTEVASLRPVTDNIASMRTEIASLRPLIEQLRRTAVTEDRASAPSREIEAERPDVAPLQEPGMLRSDPPVDAPVPLWTAGRRTDTCKADSRACAAKVLEDASTGGTALPATLGAGLAYAGYEALKNDHPFKLTEAGFGAAVATGFCCSGTIAKAIAPIHDRASGARFARDARNTSLPYAAARRELTARFGSPWLHEYESWARDPKSGALSYTWELAKSSVTELDQMKVPAEVRSDLALLREVRKSDTIPEALKELDKLCRVNPAGEDMSIAKIADEHIAEIAPTCGSLFIRRSQPPIVVTNVSERAMTTSPV